MDNTRLIKEGLQAQGLPIYDTDIPYIQNILLTMKQAQETTNHYPYLNTELPITVVDKGVFK